MNFSLKTLLIGTLSIISLSAQATTTTQSCKFQVLSSTVEVQLIDESLSSKTTARIIQNGEVTLESNDISKISYKRVDQSKPADLSQFQNTVAMDLIRYNLTKLDLALLDSVEFTEIDAAGNRDDATGASMLIVKTKADTFVFGQVGMAATSCEYTLKIQN